MTVSILKAVVVILAIICGVVLVASIPTGELSSEDIAGIGIIFAALAAVVP